MPEVACPVCALSLKLANANAEEPTPDHTASGVFDKVLCTDEVYGLVHERHRLYQSSDNPTSIVAFSVLNTDKERWSMFKSIIIEDSKIEISLSDDALLLLIQSAPKLEKLVIATGWVVGEPTGLRQMPTMAGLSKFSAHAKEMQVLELRLNWAVHQGVTRPSQMPKLRKLGIVCGKRGPRPWTSPMALQLLSLLCPVGCYFEFKPKGSDPSFRTLQSFDIFVRGVMSLQKLYTHESRRPQAFIAGPERSGLTKLVTDVIVLIYQQMEPDDAQHLFHVLGAINRTASIPDPRNVMKGRGSHKDTSGYVIMKDFDLTRDIFERGVSN